METDEDPRSSHSSYQNIYNTDSEEPQSETTPSWNDPSLPSVAVGNEQWHSLFSRNWVPVLVRDASVQRSMVSFFHFIYSLQHISQIYLSSHHVNHFLILTLLE